VTSTRAIGILSPGTRLRERYRLERLIGTGGMASVWLAEDEALARDVAVKIISDTLAADPVWVQRFEREARLAASVNHPNVVPVFDYSVERGRPFLVMHYVAGGTLAEELDRGEDLDAELIARQLFEAVSHIHGAGLLHRDIKPANVLIETDGRVRVTDFGVAQQPEATRLTSTGNVLGTARYMAPEVLAGEPATPRSDLFACGRVLEALVRDDPRAPLQGLIGSLTASDASRRPDSAEAALGMLAGPPTTPTRRLPRVPREPSSPSSAATERQPRRDAGTDPPRAPLAQRRRRARAAWIGGAILAAAAIVVLLLSTGARHVAPPRAAPSNAPLQQQLKALAGRLEYATRR
jgi:serine/threonine protein kinase